MGVLYSCIPITDTPEIQTWLHEHSATLPSQTMFARNPTPQDIRTTLGTLENYTVDYGVRSTFWHADIFYAPDPEHGPCTSIIVLNYQDDESRPYDIYFEKGWPELILTIMEQLSRLCGPLLCVPDTGNTPIVVVPGLKPSEAIHAWYE